MTNDKIQEQLLISDNNSFITDCKSIDKIVKEYISDRKEMYESVLDSSLDDDSLKIYHDYFCKKANEFDKDCHPHLYRILHFLNRDYESYLEGTICNNANDVIHAICNVNEYKDFETEEFDYIKNIEKTWNIFMESVLTIPILDVKSMNFENKYGVSIYKSKDCDKFTNETFDEFLETIHKYFPNTLSRLDAIVIADEEYIHLIGDGKYSVNGSTCAYYTDGCLFLANKLHEGDDMDEEKRFSTIVYYHEFSHFIYQMLSETSQIYWCNNYKTWRNNKISMTRDDDRNSQLWEDDEHTIESGENCEELFADANAYLLYNTTKFAKTNPLTEEDYIHKPSSIILSAVDFMIRYDFNLKKYML